MRIEVSESAEPGAIESRIQSCSGARENQSAMGSSQKRLAGGRIHRGEHSRLESFTVWGRGDAMGMDRHKDCMNRMYQGYREV